MGKGSGSESEPFIQWTADPDPSSEPGKTKRPLTHLRNEQCLCILELFGKGELSRVFVLCWLLECRHFETSQNRFLPRGQNFYLISGSRFIYTQIIIWVVDAKKTRVSQVFYILEYIEKESCHLDKYFVK